MSDAKLLDFKPKVPRTVVDDILILKTLFDQYSLLLPTFLPSIGQSRFVSLEKCSNLPAAYQSVADSMEKYSSYQT